MAAPFVVPVNLDFSAGERQALQFSQKLNSYFKPISIFNTGGFDRPLGKLSDNALEFEKSMKAANARVLAFGASVGVIYGVQRAFSEMVKSAISVEKQLTDINVILNASQDNLSKFSDSLFNIARNTGQSFKDVATAATEFARQGLGMQETLKRTNDALVLTRLSGINAADAVEALTATINSFSKSALDSTEVVNKFAAVDAAFAISAGDLAEAVKRVGSVAEDAGVSLDELVAIVTTAKQVTGREASVIGNAFKTIFTRLQRPEVIQDLEDLGVSARDANGNVRPLLEVFNELAGVIDGVSHATKIRIEQEVGSVYQINTLKAALSDLNKEYGIYKSALDIASNSTDQATRRNEELNKTIAAQLSITKNNLTQFGASIGQSVVNPALKRVLDITNGALDVVNSKDTGDIGQKFGKGIVDGIGSYLSGPGLIIIGAILRRVFQGFAKFVADASGTLLNINSLVKQRADVESAVLNILTKESSLQQAILSGTVSQEQAQSRVLQLLREEVLLRERAASFVRGAADNIISAGANPLPRRTRRAADGLIPNFADYQPKNAAEAKTIERIAPRGLIPNYNNPLIHAIEREKAAGVAPSKIKVGKSPQLVSRDNPLGLGVYNTEDEPAGLEQGIRRAYAEGLNPKTYGVPNYANIILRRSDIVERKSYFSNTGKYYVNREGAPAFYSPKKPLDFEEIPDILYHITKSVSGIDKAKEIYAFRDGGGLGGGQFPGVSATTDRGLALGIRNDFRNATRLQKTGDFDEFSFVLNTIMQKDGIHPYAAEQIIKNFREDYGYRFEPNKNSLIQSYFNERERFTKKPNPIFLSSHKYAEYDPSDIGVVGFSKTNIPREALVSYGTDDFNKELRIASSIPLKERFKFFKNKGLIPNYNQYRGYKVIDSRGYVNPNETSGVALSGFLGKYRKTLQGFKGESLDDLLKYFAANNPAAIEEALKLGLIKEAARGLIPNYASKYSLGYGKFKSNIFGLKDIFKKPKETLQKLPFRIAGSVGALGAGLFVDKIKNEPLIAQQFYSAARYLSGVGGVRNLKLSKDQLIEEFSSYDNRSSRALQGALLNEGSFIPNQVYNANNLGNTLGGFRLGKNKKGFRIQDAFDFDNSTMREGFSTSKGFSENVTINRPKNKILSYLFNKIPEGEKKVGPLGLRSVKYALDDIDFQSFDIHGEDLDFAKYGSPFLTRINFPKLSTGLIPNYAPIRKNAFNPQIRLGEYLGGGSYKDIFSVKSIQHDLFDKRFNLNPDDVVAGVLRRKAAYGHSVQDFEIHEQLSNAGAPVPKFYGYSDVNVPIGLARFRGEKEKFRRKNAAIIEKVNPFNLTDNRDLEFYTGFQHRSDPEANISSALTRYLQDRGFIESYRTSTKYLRDGRQIKLPGDLPLRNLGYARGYEKSDVIRELAQIAQFPVDAQLGYGDFKFIDRLFQDYGLRVVDSGYLRPKKSAAGLIPNFVKPEHLSEAIGAIEGGYQPGQIKELDVPNLGRVVYNTAEKVVDLGFAQPAIMPPVQSKAGQIYRENFINRHGFNPYTEKPFSAAGLIPNFADSRLVTGRDIVSLSPEEFFRLEDEIKRTKSVLRKFTQNIGFAATEAERLGKQFDLNAEAQRSLERRLKASERASVKPVRGLGRLPIQYSTPYTPDFTPTEAAFPGSDPTDRIVTEPKPKISPPLSIYSSAPIVSRVPGVTPSIYTSTPPNLQSPPISTFNQPIGGPIGRLSIYPLKSSAQEITDYQNALRRSGLAQKPSLAAEIDRINEGYGQGTGRAGETPFVTNPLLVQKLAENRLKALERERVQQELAQRREARRAKSALNQQRYGNLSFGAGFAATIAGGVASQVIGDETYGSRLAQASVGAGAGAVSGAFTGFALTGNPIGAVAGGLIGLLPSLLDVVKAFKDNTTDLSKELEQLKDSAARSADSLSRYGNATEVLANLGKDGEPVNINVVNRLRKQQSEAFANLSPERQARLNELEKLEGLSGIKRFQNEIADEDALAQQKTDAVIAFRKLASTGISQRRVINDQIIPVGGEFGPLVVPTERTPPELKPTLKADVENAINRLLNARSNDNKTSLNVQLLNKQTLTTLENAQKESAEAFLEAFKKAALAAGNDLGVELISIVLQGFKEADRPVFVEEFSKRFNVKALQNQEEAERIRAEAEKNRKIDVRRFDDRVFTTSQNFLNANLDFQTIQRLSAIGNQGRIDSFQTLSRGAIENISPFVGDTTIANLRNQTELRQIELERDANLNQAARQFQTSANTNISNGLLEIINNELSRARSSIAEPNKVQKAAFDILEPINQDRNNFNRLLSAGDINGATVALEKLLDTLNAAREPVAKAAQDPNNKDNLNLKNINEGLGQVILTLTQTYKELQGVHTQAFTQEKIRLELSKNLNTQLQDQIALQKKINFGGGIESVVGGSSQRADTLLKALAFSRSDNETVRGEGAFLFAELEKSFTDQVSPQNRRAIEDAYVRNSSNFSGVFNRFPTEESLREMARLGFQSRFRPEANVDLGIPVPRINPAATELEILPSTGPQTGLKDTKINLSTKSLLADISGLVTYALGSLQSPEYKDPGNIIIPEINTPQLPQSDFQKDLEQIQRANEIMKRLAAEQSVNRAADIPDIPFNALSDRFPTNNFAYGSASQTFIDRFNRPKTVPPINYNPIVPPNLNPGGISPLPNQPPPANFRGGLSYGGISQPITPKDLSATSFQSKTLEYGGISPVSLPNIPPVKTFDFKGFQFGGISPNRVNRVDRATAPQRSLSIEVASLGDLLKNPNDPFFPTRRGKTSAPTTGGADQELDKLRAGIDNFLNELSAQSGSLRVDTGISPRNRLAIRPSLARGVADINYNDRGELTEDEQLSKGLSILKEDLKLRRDREIAEASLLKRLHSELLIEGKISAELYRQTYNRNINAKLEKDGKLDIKDIGGGFVNEFRYEQRDLYKDIYEDTTDLARHMKSSFKDAFQTFASGAKSSKDIVRELGISILTNITNKAIDRSVDIIGGAAVSGLSSAFSSFRRKASGGPVYKNYNQGGYVQRFASGGQARPGLVISGSGIVDDNPVILKEGDYVLKQSSVNKYGVAGIENILLTNRFEYDNELRPTTGKANIDPRLSAIALDDENNPQNALRLERENALYNYVNARTAYDKQKEEAMKQYRRGIRNQMIAAYVSAAIQVGGAAFQARGGAGGVKPNNSSNSYYSGTNAYSGNLVSPTVVNNGNGTISYIGRAMGGPVFKNYGSGGIADNDNVPAMVMKGEMIIPRETVNRVGRNFLDKLNRGEIKKYAYGGVVGENNLSISTPNLNVISDPLTRLVGLMENLTQTLAGKTQPTQGQNGPQFNFEINIEAGGGAPGTQPQGQAATQTQNNNQGITPEQAKELGNSIRAAVKEVITKELRSGGILSNEFQKRG